MINKKASVAGNYLIGIVLFSAIISLSFLMVSGIAENYNRPDIIDPNFQTSFDRLENNTQTIDAMLNATSNRKGVFGALEIFLESTFTVVELIFSSMDTTKDQVINIGLYFGIPTSVFAILGIAFLASLVVIIVLIVINAINKTERL